MHAAILKKSPHCYCYLFQQNKVLLTLKGHPYVVVLTTVIIKYETEQPFQFGHILIYISGHQQSTLTVHKITIFITQQLSIQFEEVIASQLMLMFDS